MNEARMQDGQTQLVAQVYELTIEIETAVKLSDWQRAARLARERSPMVRAITASQSPSALEMIRHIRTSNAARLVDARTAQAELAAKYRGAAASIGAARQYQRIYRHF